MQLAGREDSVEERIFGRFARIAPDCIDLQAQALGEQRTLATDLAVTEHAHGAFVGPIDQKMIPAPLALIVDEPPDLLGMKQDPEDGEFGERALEYAARVRHHDRALEKFGKQQYLDARGQRVNPPNRARLPPKTGEIERRAQPGDQQDLGVRDAAREFRRIIADTKFTVRAQGLE